MERMIEKDTGDLVEALSALAHEQWAGWMLYLFKHGQLNDDGTFTIDADSARRWSRQVCTTYENLPENEKESDRKEARCVLEVLKKWIE